MFLSNFRKMHYFLKNYGMSVKIHHFSIRLCVPSKTTVQQKCGVTVLHSWLYTLGGFGCYKRHENTCKMNPSLKNCKKIRNWIICFFPLESENNLLHEKKITTLPTVSFIFYRLKMESFLYSLGSRQMGEKNCKMRRQKFECERCLRMMS